MNKHFHYYAIRVLAQSAGLSPEDAETLAYASQYVDDATEHKPLYVRDAPALAEPQHIAGAFDPICAAHSGVQYLAYQVKDIQRKVYIAFHFVPGHPWTGGRFDYRVTPGGDLATEVLDLALDRLRRTPLAGEPRVQALIKTGIALHAYADTWAHQRFSGRASNADNDIQDRYRFEDGEWREVPFFERLLLDIAPNCGHAEAGAMPDASWLRWRYRHVASNEVYVRDNLAEFSRAAEGILEKLAAVTGHTGATLPSGVGACLADRTDAAEAWAQAFPRVFTAPQHYSGGRPT